jgi:hypothetical protein
MAYHDTPTLPMFLGEANYEGENIQGGLPGPATAYDIRLENYWAITSGAAGVEYGDNPVYLFGSDFIAHLNDPGGVQTPYVRILAASFPFYSFVPDSTHQLVTAGYGTYNGSTFALESENYCPTSWNGSTKSITYCPQATTLTVDMSKFMRPVRARWFDPTNGTYKVIGIIANSGTHDFTSPAAHSDGKRDWVLALDMAPASVIATVRGH